MNSEYDYEIMNILYYYFLHPVWSIAGEVWAGLSKADASPTKQ
jgi:hypothetical protein